MAVTSATTKALVAGQRVIFAITQPTVPQAFVYPPNVVNPGDINPTASSLTIQEFIVRTNGYLYPIGPATYN